MEILYRNSHISFLENNNLLFTVPTSFRGENLLNFSQPETRIAHGHHVFENGKLFIIPAYFLPNFGSFDEAVPEEKMF
jgi:hypothetical protein